MTLLFLGEPESSSRELAAVRFQGHTGVGVLACAVAWEALEALAGEVGLDEEACLRVFRWHRELVQNAARDKYEAV